MDGTYPRHYYDAQLEGDKEEILAESIDHLIARSVSLELKKDWKHRIEGDTIDELFKEVEKYLNIQTP